MSPETLKIIDFPLVFKCFFDFQGFQHKYKFWVDLGRSWRHPGHLLGPLGASLGRLGGILGASWGRLGASWGRLGASWGSWRHLGPSWRRLGLENPPKINLTRHGTGSAAFLKGSLLQKPCGTTLDRKASSRSPLLRSLRWPYGVSLGFRWGFASVLL